LADPRVRVIDHAGENTVAAIPSASLDFAYLGSGIDPGAELAPWATKVRPGGLLAGAGYTGAVKQVVDEFARGLGRAVGFATGDPDPPDWFLRTPINPAPPPDRVAVVTAFDAGYASVGAISRPNKEAYCRRHGYRFVCRTDGFDTSRPASWSKLRFVREALREADWVFWSDADSLVMDSAVPLPRFVWDCADLVLSADPYHGLNFGGWLARASDWTDAFLQTVDGMNEFLDHPWWETAAVFARYAADPAVRAHIALLPNTLFNGYPFPGGGYTSGDFVAHFPSLRGRQREDAMTRYAALAR
jgi:hypothetical protein